MARESVIVGLKTYRSVGRRAERCQNVLTLQWERVDGQSGKNGLVSQKSTLFRKKILKKNECKKDEKIEGVGIKLNGSWTENNTCDGGRKTAQLPND